MAKTRDYIKVPADAIQKLCEATGSGQTSVYDALKYNTNSPKAKEIQRMALEDYGGVILKRVVKW